MPASSSSQIAAGPKIHQLWQAVILKPFKLQECILHFRKPLIFINLVSAGQDHSYVLNTRFWLQKRSTFHRACVIGVYILFSLTVTRKRLLQHENITPIESNSTISKSIRLKKIKKKHPFWALLQQKVEKARTKMYTK